MQDPPSVSAEFIEEVTMATRWTPWIHTTGLLAMSVAVAVTLAAAPQAQTASPQGAVTFTKDVAPILQKSCQTCHRPGSVAPMSLLTYEDARPWARAIKLKVTAREMPPWHIDRTIGITKFKDDPSLTDAEIATISKWVDSGAPMGDPKDMPPPRQFADQDRWFIGKPDVVVAMDTPYVLPAAGPDNIVDVLIDPGFTEDMYISAIESKPVDAKSFKVVHHFTTNLVEDPENDPTGLFLNEYALGKNGDIFPPNSGRLVKAGTKINFNLHLNPRGEETPVRVAVAWKVYPKAAVPKYVAFTQHMGDAADLDIPAGAIARHDGYFRLPRPALIASFQPHMHNRGKAQCIEAIYPDVRADSARPGPARTETISCVSNYQFGWHITYPYADDVAPLLPAGTIVHVMSWHDNTISNRWNPNPKNWVGFGQRSIDEMSFAWITITYLDEEDYKRRVEERQTKKTTQQHNGDPGLVVSR
jgi:mono/diheme cytochrome c family protein